MGGCASAARLAKAGCKVTIFEKNDFTGGRCSLIHRDDYVWNDTSSYFNSYTCLIESSTTSSWNISILKRLKTRRRFD